MESKQNLWYLQEDDKLFGDKGKVLTQEQYMVLSDISRKKFDKTPVRRVKSLFDAGLQNSLADMIWTTPDIPESINGDFGFEESDEDE